MAAIFDVSEADFQARVLERSREVPVVVDLWAEWCAPCRTLGPALEAVVSARGGAVELGKVDVDKNQGLAAAFGVRGIPAVKAFREAQVVAEFTGAAPRQQIEAFLDGLVPSEADRLAAAGDEASLRRALEAEPGHLEAGRALARILVTRGELDEASELLARLAGDFVAEGLAARVELTRTGDPQAGADALDRAFEAWDSDDVTGALERLQEVVASTDDAERRDLIRRVMVAIFTELGPADPRAREYRRRLSAALV